MSNDRLVELITALNQSEKRYFKQFVNRHSANNSPTKLSRFFDFLANAKKYDAKEVLKKCDFIKPNQLQNMRVRLYDTISSSLRAYYSNSSIEIQLYQIMINHEILIKKGLYEQCWKLLRKAEVLAMEYENFLILEHIHLQQEYLMTVRLKNKNAIEMSAKIRENRNLALDIKGGLNRLEKSAANCYKVFKTEGRFLRDSSVADEVMSEFKQLEKELSIHTESYKINFALNYNLSLIYRLTGQIEKAIYYVKKVEVLFKKTDVIKRNFREYQKFLNLYVILCNESGRYVKAGELIAEIRNYKSDSEVNKDHQILIFENAVFQEIETYLQKCDFETAVELIELNLEAIGDHSNKIHTVNQQSKFYRIALAYFGSGNYRMSLRWVNRIINFTEIKYRKDILSSVQLLNLLIHYELKNFDLLTNRLQTTRNYLKKIGRLLIPEQELLLALNQITSYQKSEKEAFLQLKENLAKNEIKNPLDHYSMAYFDLIAWLSRKINTNENRKV